MKCDGYREFFKWRVVCEHGTITDDQLLDPRNTLDPQQPPPEYGQALKVELIPQQDYLRPAECPVPPGCLPICHAHPTYNVDTKELVSLHFQIGFCVNGTRCMQDIDCATGNLKGPLLDQRGRTV